MSLLLLPETLNNMFLFLPTNDLLQAILVSRSWAEIGILLLWRSLHLCLDKERLAITHLLFLRLIDSRLTKNLPLHVPVSYQRDHIKSVTLLLGGSQPVLHKDLTLHISHIAKGMASCPKLERVVMQVTELPQVTTIDFILACWDYEQLASLRILRVDFSTLDSSQVIPRDTLEAILRLATVAGKGMLELLEITLPSYVYYELSLRNHDYYLPFKSLKPLLHLQKSLRSLTLAVNIIPTSASGTDGPTAHMAGDGDEAVDPNSDQPSPPFYETVTALQFRQPLAWQQHEALQHLHLQILRITTEQGLKQLFNFLDLFPLLQTVILRFQRMNDVAVLALPTLWQKSKASLRVRRLEIRILYASAANTLIAGGGMEAGSTEEAPTSVRSVQAFSNPAPLPPTSSAFTINWKKSNKLKEFVFESYPEGDEERIISRICPEWVLQLEPRLIKRLGVVVADPEELKCLIQPFVHLYELQVEFQCPSEEVLILAMTALKECMSDSVRILKLKLNHDLTPSLDFLCQPRPWLKKLSWSFKEGVWWDWP